MLALVVSLRVKPGHREAFLEAITKSVSRLDLDRPSGMIVHCG